MEQKNCKKCNRILPAEARFCPFCMYTFDVVGEKAAAAGLGQVVPEKATGKKGKKRYKMVLILAAAVVIAVMLGVLINVGIRNAAEDNKNNDGTLNVEGSSDGEAGAGIATVSDATNGTIGDAGTVNNTANNAIGNSVGIENGVANNTTNNTTGSSAGTANGTANNMTNNTTGNSAGTVNGTANNTANNTTGNSAGTVNGTANNTANNTTGNSAGTVNGTVNNTANNTTGNSAGIANGAENNTANNATGNSVGTASGTTNDNSSKDSATNPTIESPEKDTVTKVLLTYNWSNIYSQVSSKLASNYPSHTFVTSSSGVTSYGYDNPTVVAYSYSTNGEYIEEAELATYQSNMVNRIYSDLVSGHESNCAYHLFVGVSYNVSGDSATFYGYYY